MAITKIQIIHFQLLTIIQILLIFFFLSNPIKGSEVRFETGTTGTNQQLQPQQTNYDYDYGKDSSDGYHSKSDTELQITTSTPTSARTIPTITISVPDPTPEEQKEQEEQQRKDEILCTPISIQVAITRILPFINANFESDYGNRTLNRITFFCHEFVELARHGSNPRHDRMVTVAGMPDDDDGSFASMKEGYPQGYPHGDGHEHEHEHGQGQDGVYVGEDIISPHDDNAHEKGDYDDYELFREFCGRDEKSIFGKIKEKIIGKHPNDDYTDGNAFMNVHQQKIGNYTLQMTGRVIPEEWKFIDYVLNGTRYISTLLYTISFLNHMLA